MRRQSKKDFQQKAVLDKEFEHYHEEGPKLHGYAWIRMNELMINAALACRVDYTQQPFKTMLTLCALKALNQMKASDAPRRKATHGTGEKI